MESLDGHRFRLPVKSKTLIWNSAFRHFRKYAQAVVAATEKKWRDKKEATNQEEHTIVGEGEAVKKKKKKADKEDHEEAQE